jgi:hypothetical protein
MIKTIKCVTKGCEFEGKVFSTTSFFFARVAPLDGPFICPKCYKRMKIVAYYPLNKGRSGKTMPRTTSSRPTAHKVGKKKKKPGLTLKGYSLGNPKRRSKPVAKKPGPRKLGPSK